MLHPELGHLDEAIAPASKLEADLFSGADAPEAYRVAYVSKMFAVKADDLPENQRRQLTADDMRARAKLLKDAKERKQQLVDEGKLDEADQVMRDYEAEIAAATAAAGGASADDAHRDVLIGFARLYSGTVSLGQTLYAVLPKYNADLAPSHAHNAKHLAPVKVEQLYMMMGRELLAVKEVQAGNLFAVGGLEGTVLRNATLCGMGLGKEVKDGAARDEDRDCLVNLAGVTNTVRSTFHLCRSFLCFADELVPPSSPRRLALLDLLPSSLARRPRRSSESPSSRRTRPRCPSSSRASDCSTRPTPASRRSSSRPASTSSSPPASFTSRCATSLPSSALSLWSSA